MCFDLPPLTHSMIFHIQYTLQSSFSNIHYDLPPQHCSIFLKHTSQYSSSTHQNHYDLTNHTKPCSSTSFQHCDPPSPCDPSSVNQKKQMEGVARQHGMWNVGVVYISPCHWSVSKMKVCDSWARSQWEQAQPLTQTSPTKGEMVPALPGYLCEVLKAMFHVLLHRVLSS
jgi:hypothetical protein